MVGCSKCDGYGNVHDVNGSYSCGCGLQGRMGGRLKDMGISPSTIKAAANMTEADRQWFIKKFAGNTTDGIVLYSTDGKQDTVGALLLSRAIELNWSTMYIDLRDIDGARQAVARDNGPVGKGLMLIDNLEFAIASRRSTYTLLDIVHNISAWKIVGILHENPTVFKERLIDGLKGYISSRYEFWGV